MSQGYKICPICGTPSHPNATLCSTCGTSLADVPITAERRKPSTGEPRYDRRYGETDLLEGGEHRRIETILFGGALVLLAVICVGAVAFAGVRWLLPGAPPTPTPTATSALSPAPELVLATNTLPPPPALATVTPLPPTATATETPGPCMKQVNPGDDLISIAWACGHRSLDVMPLILQMNNLSAPELIQVGQTISVPWPTPTLDPDNPATPTGESASNTSGISDTSFSFITPTALEVIPGLELASLPTQGPPTAAPTPTLLPGIMWHVVQPNENAASIAYRFNTTLETLSQLNPEVTFSQCDYGSPSGGESCVVVLQIGQQMRVPAPTPTATLSPTRSGSETPTPTLTPTYNAPSALSPADRTLFAKGELITLRWVASGTLGSGDTYRVHVDDLTAERSYDSDTTELFFIVPSAWQGQDGARHDYRWTVSLVQSDRPDEPIFTTEPRLFTWEGR